MKTTAFVKKVQKHTSSKAILLDCIWCRILYGIRPEQYFVLDMAMKSHRCRKQYISTATNDKLLKLLNSDQADRPNIGNKYLFNKKFAEFIYRDWLYCADADKNEIEEFMQKHPRVLMKLVGETQGKGIELIQGMEDLQRLGGADALIQKKCLLEDFIVQHHELAAFNPDSVNTVRVYTLKDRNGKVYIFGAALRIGAPNNYVDNFHAGGCAYSIDVESGIVEAKGIRTVGKERVIFHPGTDKCVLGFRIPNWEKIEDTVIRAAEISNLRLLGWDVAVTEDGAELIEANNGADIDLAQFTHGVKDTVNAILKDDGIRI